MRRAGWKRDLLWWALLLALTACLAGVKLTDGARFDGARFDGAGFSHGPADVDPAGLRLVGKMTYYASGVMELVYQNRLGWGHVQPCPKPECVGYIALVEHHVGARVWLQRPGHEMEGPYLVVDCGAREDLPGLRARGIVGEVDWPTAVRWGMRGPLAGVVVWFERPDEAAAAELPATPIMPQATRTLTATPTPIEKPPTGTPVFVADAPALGLRPE